LVLVDLSLVLLNLTLVLPDLSLVLVVLSLDLTDLTLVPVVLSLDLGDLSLVLLDLSLSWLVLTLILADLSFFLPDLTLDGLVLSLVWTVPGLDWAALNSHKPFTNRGFTQASLVLPETGWSLAHQSRHPATGNRLQMSPLSETLFFCVSQNKKNTVSPMSFRGSARFIN
jgi:hypothetical protein